MIKTMKTKIIYSLLIVLFTMSCSEDILDVPNENAYNGDTFFTTPAAYEEAATAMYTPLLHNGMYAREFYFIFDLLGNDADKNFRFREVYWIFHFIRIHQIMEK